MMDDKGFVLWAVCFGGALLVLLLLAIFLPKDPQLTGRQPRGKVSDTPPRPTPPPRRASYDLEGDIMIAPKPPTRVVRPGESGTMTPNCPTVDWAQVQRPPGSAVMPPANPRLKDRG